MCERLIRAAVRVTPVTEQGRRSGIGRLGGQGRFDGRHVIKARGKLHVRSPRRARARAAAAAPISPSRSCTTAMW